jgi:hypothetical protein
MFSFDVTAHLSQKVLKFCMTVDFFVPQIMISSEITRQNIEHEAAVDKLDSCIKNNINGDHRVVGEWRRTSAKPGPCIR